MFSTRYSNWIAFAALFSLVNSDANSICYSYGVDYVDEGHYFINANSYDPFTCVSTFEGCNNDLADVMLVEPDGDELICSQVETYPNDQRMLSVCPIRKDQMTSGHWILLILGNNGDGQPFAWQRDLYLTVGPQATITETPTRSFTLTNTPTTTKHVVSFSVFVTTVGPLYTVTIPSVTAKKTRTVTPGRVTVGSTSTMTITRLTSSRVYAVVTQTATAACNVPGRPTRPDKPCEYSPTLLHPEALVTPTSIPAGGPGRWWSRSDRRVDYEWARGRVEAAKKRRDAKAGKGKGKLQRREPDVPTTTITLMSNLPSTTTTYYAPTVTVTDLTVFSKTSTATLPPSTVVSGRYTYTVTLPTPTRTKVRFVTVTQTSTYTWGGTFTNTVVVTPPAAVESCRWQGGYFGNSWGW